MTKQVLTITRGDSRDIPFQVFDINGEAMPSDQIQSIYFTVKKLTTDEDEDAIIAKANGDGIVVVDPEVGTYVVNIDPEDTIGLTGYLRGLNWDIEVVTVLNKVYTVASGLMAIEADVTQRIA